MPTIEPFNPVKELLEFGNFGLVGKCDRDRLIQIARWLETKLQDYDAIVRAFPELGGAPIGVENDRDGFAVMDDGWNFLSDHYPTREEAILAYARKLQGQP